MDVWCDREGVAAVRRIEGIVCGEGLFESLLCEPKSRHMPRLVVPAFGLQPKLCQWHYAIGGVKSCKAPSLATSTVEQERRKRYSADVF